MVIRVLSNGDVQVDSDGDAEDEAARRSLRANTAFNRYSGRRPSNWVQSQVVDRIVSIAAGAGSGGVNR